MTIKDILALPGVTSRGVNLAALGHAPSPLEASSPSRPLTTSGSPLPGLLAMPVVSLRLPWPPTVNTYYRATLVDGEIRVLISKAGRAYRKAVRGVVEATGEMLAHGRYAVTVMAFPKDRRRCDVDNLNKAILDSLTKAGVWRDDSLVDDLRIVRCPPGVKGSPFVQVLAKVIPEQLEAA